MTVGGTQAEYVVDIWSGNHPFSWKTGAIMTDVGQVTRFGDKYGDLVTCRSLKPWMARTKRVKRRRHERKRRKRSKQFCI